jgi:hypothetical protein
MLVISMQTIAQLSARLLLLSAFGLPLATTLCALDTCLAQSSQNLDVGARKNVNFSVPESFTMTSCRQFSPRDIDPLTHRQIFGHFLGPVAQPKNFFQESRIYAAPSQGLSQWSPWPSPSACPPFRIVGTSASQQRELENFLNGKTDCFTGYDCESNY